MTARLFSIAACAPSAPTLLGQVTSPVRLGSPSAPQEAIEDRAVRWAEEGALVLPLNGLGIPITGGWSTAADSPDAVRAMTVGTRNTPAWRVAEGVGVVGGRFVVLDIDEFAKARRVLPSLDLPPTAMCWSPSAAPGKPRAQLWFRAAGADVGSYNCIERGGFEIKGTGSLLRAPWSRRAGVAGKPNGTYLPADPCPEIAVVASLNAVGAAYRNPPGSTCAGSDGWATGGLVPTSAETGLIR